MEIKAFICAENPLDAPQAGSSRLSFNIRSSDSDFTRPRGGFTIVTNTKSLPKVLLAKGLLTIAEPKFDRKRNSCLNSEHRSSLGANTFAKARSSTGHQYHPRGIRSPTYLFSHSCKPFQGVLRSL